MILNRVKCLSVAAFSLLFVLFSNVALANDEHAGEEKPKVFDADKVIFGHVLDAHEFHFFDYADSEGHLHPVSLPLPIIVYSAERGFDMFMSSKFEHGHAAYNGYKIHDERIFAVNEAGEEDASVKVYDFSITRNVAQMLIAMTVLVWIMISAAKKYKKGIGRTSAPKGFQNALETAILFIRDEVAKPNLGAKYERFLPFLLSVFFFILINNIFGLIPGAANVTGNIVFTAVLGIISFFVINFNGSKSYWGHIFNPPVPTGINLILIPVEILGVFTKPFSLIVRLFANMLAGHIIIICLISLIFIFGNFGAAAGFGFAPVSIAFTIFIYFIEVLVAFIQAYIFTNLTAVFLGGAMEEHHHEEHAH